MGIVHIRRITKFSNFFISGHFLSDEEILVNLRAKIKSFYLLHK